MHFFLKIIKEYINYYLNLSEVYWMDSFDYKYDDLKIKLLKKT